MSSSRRARRLRRQIKGNRHFKAGRKNRHAKLNRRYRGYK